MKAVRKFVVALGRRRRRGARVRGCRLGARDHEPGRREDEGPAAVHSLGPDREGRADDDEDRADRPSELRDRLVRARRRAGWTQNVSRRDPARRRSIQKRHLVGRPHADRAGLGLPLQRRDANDSGHGHVHGAPDLLRRLRRRLERAGELGHAGARRSRRSTRSAATAERRRSRSSRSCSRSRRSWSPWSRSWAGGASGRSHEAPEDRRRRASPSPSWRWRRLPPRSPTRPCCARRRRRA